MFEACSVVLLLQHYSDSVLKMILLLFVWLLCNMFSSCVAQCLVSYLDNPHCPPTSRDVSVYTVTQMSLYQCAERCVLGDRVKCQTFLWKQSVNECFVSTKKCEPTFETEPGNTIMSRVICDAKDFRISLPLSVKDFTRARRVHNLKGRNECSSICSALLACFKSIWNRTASICNIYESDSLKPNTVLRPSRKDRRCVTLRVGANAYHGTSMDIEFSVCLNKLLSNRTHAVEWNTKIRMCFLHSQNKAFTSSYKSTMLPVIQMSKNSNCSINRWKNGVHLTFLPKRKLEGGLLVRNTPMSSGTCRDLCVYSANCYATSWGRNTQECFFHTFYKQLVTVEDFDTFIINSSTIATHPGGNRNTRLTSFFRRPARNTTPELTSSYYKRISADHRTMRSNDHHSLINCAWLCEMTTGCVGFSRESQPRHQKSDCHLKTDYMDVEFMKLQNFILKKYKVNYKVQRI